MPGLDLAAAAPEALPVQDTLELTAAAIPPRWLEYPFIVAIGYSGWILTVLHRRLAPSALLEPVGLNCVFLVNLFSRTLLLQRWLSLLCVLMVFERDRYFCVYRKCFRCLSSVCEKWEQKQKYCIYIFVHYFGHLSYIKVWLHPWIHIKSLN